MLTAMALGVSGPPIYMGLAGFNSCLTAVCVGGMFFVLSWRCVAGDAMRCDAMRCGSIGFPFSKKREQEKKEEKEEKQEKQEKQEKKEKKKAKECCLCV
jgi:hypothetical protein